MYSMVYITNYMSSYHKEMLSKVIQSYPKCYPKLSIFVIENEKNESTNLAKYS